MAHRMLLETLTPADTRVVIGGEEAEHARKVKRLEPGDSVTLMNGRGLIAQAEVECARRDLELRIVSAREEPPVSPAIDVWSATPKGPRLEDMIDALTQAGAASWRAMRTTRGVVDPRDAKIARQERVVREACKQAGRAWFMRLDERADFDDSLAPAANLSIILADASGTRDAKVAGDWVRLLVGPEGGFTPAEIASAKSAGARVVNFGPHAMRIEVAAPLAVGVILHESRR